MSGAHSLVLGSIAVSLVFGAGIFFYRFIFPKQKINLLVLLTLISILPIISIFRNGVYESGDFTIHIYRAIDFYTSLQEGNIMPSWAGNLNGEYGYPLFILNYPLPYYFISLFHFLGFSFIVSLKIVLALNLAFSGIFMYLFTKEITKNTLSAFSAGVFYIFAPYHLIDLHFKVALGELLIFTFLPLTALFFYKTTYKPTFQNILLTSLSFSFLIMSHVALAGLIGILIGFYILFLFIKKPPSLKNILGLCVGVITSMLISLYIFVAPLLYTQYTINNNAPLKTVYFPKISELLFSPWKYGLLFQGPQGELSYLIGYTQLIVFSLLVFLFFRKKITKLYKKDVLFWIFSTFILIYLISPYSKFLWEHSSFLVPIGSHRLLVLVTFCISVLAGYLVLIFKKRVFFISFLLMITIAYTILNWGHRRLIPEITDATLIDYLPYSTSRGEGHYYADSKWIDPNNRWFSQIPKQRIEIKDGEGKIIDLKRSTTFHSYILDLDKPSVIFENTLYFPGWNVQSNGKKVEPYPNSLGITAFKLPQGLQYVTLKFSDLYLYNAAKIVSLFSFLTVVLMLLSLVGRKLFRVLRK